MMADGPIGALRVALRYLRARRFRCKVISFWSLFCFVVPYGILALYYPPYLVHRAEVGGAPRGASDARGAWVMGGAGGGAGGPRVSVCDCDRVSSLERLVTPRARAPTRESHTHAPRPARFWLFICLSVERYDTHTHAPDHSPTSRVLHGVTQTPSVTDLHCTHRVPSTQKCPHATRPRAAQQDRSQMPAQPSIGNRMHRNVVPKLPPQLISSIGIPCQWVLGETMTTRAFPGGRTIPPPGERGARGAPYGRGPG